MRRECALLVAVSVASVWSFSASAGDDPIPVFSFADTSCGAWVRSQQDEIGRGQYLFWFRGFASGYNYGSETKQIPLGAMPDQQTLSLYIDKYCRENPLHPFVGAAFELVKERSVKK